MIPHETQAEMSARLARFSYEGAGNTMGPDAIVTLHARVNGEWRKISFNVETLFTTGKFEPVLGAGR